jgi:hypothetical protein
LWHFYPHKGSGIEKIAKIADFPKFSLQMGKIADHQLSSQEIAMLGVEEIHAAIQSTAFFLHSHMAHRN